MNALTRRNFMAFTVGGTVALAAGKLHAQDNAIPWTGNGLGGNDPGPQNPLRQAQNPDLVNPPLTTTVPCPTCVFLLATRTYAKAAAAGRVR